ncbi:heme biosynthesis HemY N-terminal domain-containing protein [Paraglaciecola sp. MB-3u-78]|uniref:heme biosynthesis HemY N-terminal domain-containing protein n=1 Tax=Paraglaciecola sp. MB-3u-78 TaxID=2058332 RepID=UPI000C34583D|nr:heme biosynthesis HemY N-terminal domain-containing protein [Paraglaciecola sp. MB-3u-78]PKG98607.1 heme biosynthesis protein HemY [Paraglaciecola sp. MB-3u-78]
MSHLIRIFLVLVLLLIGVVIAAMIFDDSGYVMVEFNGWVVEMNVWSLCLSLIAIFVGLMLINLLIKTSLAAASGSKNWLGNWGDRKKKKAFTAGLIALAETNYLLAQENFKKIENEDFDGINLLAAAEVEMQLGQPEQAKSYWRLATTYEKSTLAANLCLIRDALQHHQSDEAITLIQSLSEKQQAQTPVLKLWAQALGQAGKWLELKGKLKGWKKALGNDYEPLMQQASKGHFAEIASKEGAGQLTQNWKSLPRTTRKDPAQQAAYIQQLIDQGMHGDAELALVEYQKSAPHPLLIPLFKLIKLPNPTAAIKTLESWLKQDGLNVELLSALGHIAFNANDKLLAEKALAKAIKLGNRREDLVLMASIKESQDDQQQALQLYKQSMGTHEN